MKIRQVEVEFFHANRQTDVKLPAEFSFFFATEPKKSLKAPHITGNQTEVFTVPL